MLFEDVANTYGANVLAVVLTRMGKNGVYGLAKVYEAAGQSIVQDEQSSVVFGMPRAALAAGLVHAVLSPDSIAERLCRFGCEPARVEGG